MSATFIQAYLSAGLASAIPVAPDVPAGCLAFYYETDTLVLKLWNTSAWINAAGGSAAPWVGQSPARNINGAGPFTLALMNYFTGSVTATLDFPAAPADQQMIVMFCNGQGASFNAGTGTQKAVGYVTFGAGGSQTKGLNANELWFAIYDLASNTWYNDHTSH